MSLRTILTRPYFGNHIRLNIITVATTGMTQLAMVMLRKIWMPGTLRRSSRARPIPSTSSSRTATAVRARIDQRGGAQDATDKGGIREQRLEVLQADERLLAGVQGASIGEAQDDALDHRIEHHQADQAQGRQRQHVAEPFPILQAERGGDSAAGRAGAELVLYPGPV